MMIHGGLENHLESFLGGILYNMILISNTLNLT